jgi:hypothetical protein
MVIKLKNPSQFERGFLLIKIVDWYYILIFLVTAII